MPLSLPYKVERRIVSELKPDLVAPLPQNSFPEASETAQHSRCCCRGAIKSSVSIAPNRFGLTIPQKKSQVEAFLFQLAHQEGHSGALHLSAPCTLQRIPRAGTEEHGIDAQREECETIFDRLGDSCLGGDDDMHPR